MKTIAKIIPILALLPIVMAIGCNKNAGSSGTAGMQIGLMDAPANFQALNLDITAVQIHNRASGWVTVNSGLGVVNILNYVNGLSVVLGNAQLPPGRVDEVKLILGPNNSVVSGGVTYTLAAPDTERLRVKVDLDDDLHAGTSYQWMIDFDAARSVIAAAGGGFILKPVLRLVVDDHTAIHDCDDFRDSCQVIHLRGRGSISGVVGVPAGVLDLAAVCAVDANNHFRCTVTGLNGDFTIHGLQPGTYSVSYTTIIPPFRDTTITNVVVVGDSTNHLVAVNL